MKYIFYSLLIIIFLIDCTRKTEQVNTKTDNDIIVSTSSKEHFMKLNIEFPRNMITEELLKQKNIPCFCKVSADFEISFQEPLPKVVGKVSEWDRHELEERALAGAGGKYTHYTNGMITLKEIDLNQYQILDLSFFCRSHGWCPIIENGIYATPINLWDEE